MGKEFVKIWLASGLPGAGPIACSIASMTRQVRSWFSESSTDVMVTPTHVTKAD